MSPTDASERVLESIIVQSLPVPTSAAGGGVILRAS